MKFLDWNECYTDLSNLYEQNFFLEKEIYTDIKLQEHLLHSLKVRR